MSKTTKGDQWPADQVERRSLDSLVPYIRNARTHSEEQVDQIAASIREWGWTVPILVAEDGTIIAGHGRVMAAKKLGLTEVPVMVAKGWSEAQKRAYTIADNQLTINSDWDKELLKIELDDLVNADFNIDLVGFSDADLKKLVGGEEEKIPDSKYSEQYGVIAICSDEVAQQETFTKLQELGYNCKVVTT